MASPRRHPGLRRRTPEAPTSGVGEQAEAGSPASNAAGSEPEPGMEMWGGVQDEAARVFERMMRQDIVLVERRLLVCDCMSVAMQLLGRNRILPFASVPLWLAAAERYAPGTVLFSLGGAFEAPDVQADIAALLTAPKPVPVIVSSDEAEPHLIMAALEMGVRGWVSSDMPLKTALQVVRLVLAGGVFIPPSVLEALRSADRQPPAQGSAVEARAIEEVLTPRQIEVLRELSRGLTNREIGEKLGMHESTVKVHIRNIMKSFSVSNRTELVIAAAPMLDGFRSAKRAES